ncbi:type III secretion system outer membrane ring subunit SctC [Yokenella regensburgei]|uniref:type III secretion system outer membrane ring subunit SctC n=1 Tax=Yokenella regensburgei TaxID=158877 RepID=UPI001432F1EF|nr:type III secretion system outer membrane ring subunit SctC [Yokenella regensburgei]QIU92583.1 EscC/YscC/HrcC family type III secretion system outer membrane ring protein [Yokenella regensburgei]
MKIHNICVVLFLFTLLIVSVSRAGEHSSMGNSGYIAKNESLRDFFYALAVPLEKNVIVSKLAARKQISGRFDFASPNTLMESLSKQLGLIWYDDGQTIYVYDTSEMRSKVISLRNISLGTFNEYLRQSGLYNERYPLRGDSRSSTFYISGPPMFVDIVANMSSLLDNQNSRENKKIGTEQQRVMVVQLNNTFVSDRTYELRGDKIVIPGMATVIGNLLRDEYNYPKNVEVNMISHIPENESGIRAMPEFSDHSESTAQIDTGVKVDKLANTLQQYKSADNIKIVAYPGTNSLLIKGTDEQVNFIEKLIQSLDVVKRQLELSLWIIDLSSESLDQLGVSWTGGVIAGNSLGVTLNQAGSVSSLDGRRFIASVMALAREKKATVVSRPVILTQENIPAIFDNNRTFYTKLIGERNSSLQHVTYGTLVSVLPRFSSDGQIEMLLNIEDGRETASINSEQKPPNDLPEVGRTHISTLARVPKNKSLLVGGYTRDTDAEEKEKIPFFGDLPLIGGLFRYSSQSKSNTVRVFLIEPREITASQYKDVSDFTNMLSKKGGRDVDQAFLHKWVRDYLSRGTPALTHGN